MLPKKYIFIINTEHHTIQLHEAINHFELRTEDIILFLFSADNNTSWADKLVLNYSIQNFIKFDNWTAKDIFFKPKIHRKYLSTLQNISRAKVQYTVLTSQYFDDSSNLAYSILKPITYYLLDEGTASFGVISNRKKANSFNIKLLIKSILYWHYLRYPQRVVFFTQYSLPVKHFDSIEKYSFTKERTSDRVFIKSHAIFLGSSLVEVKMMHEEVYLELLKKVRQNINIQHYFYFAHRKESSNKLERVRSIGFEIRQNEKPFEFIFPELELCPEVICSFYSPILDTLSKKYTQLPKFIIYRFKSGLLLKDQKIADMIFLSFSNNNRLIIRDIYI